MKKLLFFVAVLISWVSVSQEKKTIRGSVYDVSTGLPLESVNVLNISTIKGVTTNVKGEFQIQAAVKDTLHLSFLGYKSVRIVVSNDMIKYAGIRIGMGEGTYHLDEVIVQPYNLTGVLEIDAKYMPINTNKDYSISNLDIGYAKVGATSAGLKIDLIRNVFNVLSGKNKELKKLRKLKEEEELKKLLLTKFDREILSEVLQISKEELEEVLRQCNYSKEFIKTANDLQIIDAVTKCYEEYRFTKQK